MKFSFTFLIFFFVPLYAISQDYFLDEHFDGRNIVIEEKISQFRSHFYFENALYVDNKSTSERKLLDYPISIDWSKDLRIGISIEYEEGTKNRFLGLVLSDGEKNNLGIGYTPNGSHLLYSLGDIIKHEQNNKWISSNLVQQNGRPNFIEIIKIENEAYILLNQQPIYKISAGNFNFKKIILRTTRDQITKYNYAIGEYLSEGQVNNYKETLPQWLRFYNPTSTHLAHKKQDVILSQVKQPNLIVKGNFATYAGLDRPGANNKIMHYISNNWENYPVAGLNLENGTVFAFDKNNPEHFDSKTNQYFVRRKTVKKNTLSYFDHYQNGKLINSFESNKILGELEDGRAIFSKGNVVYLYNPKIKKLSEFIKTRKELYGRVFLTYDKKYIYMNLSYKRMPGAMVFDASTGIRVPQLEKLYRENTEVKFYKNGYFYAYNHKEKGYQKVNSATGTADNIDLPKYIQWKKGYRPKLIKVERLGLRANIIDTQSGHILHREVPVYQNAYLKYNSPFLYNTSTITAKVTMLGSLNEVSVVRYNLETKEQNVFLAHETQSKKQGDYKKKKLEQDKKKAELKAFLSNIRPFGQSWNYSGGSFDFINMTGNSYLLNQGIGGNIKVIGKFCGGYNEYFGTTAILTFREKNGETYIEMIYLASGGAKRDFIGLAPRDKISLYKSGKDYKLSVGNKSYTIQSNCYR